MFLSRVTSRDFLLLVAVLTFTGCEPNVPKNTTANSSKDAANKTAGESTAGLKRLIILINGESPFWDAGRAGSQTANSELKLKDKGLVAAFETNDGTAQGQLAKLQQYGTQSDIAGIAISVLDASNVAVVNELRNLQKKGIKILTLDSDVDRDQFRDARHAFIGTDNLIGGRVLGKCAKGLKTAGGEYVTFVGQKGAQNAIDRISGFAEGAGEKFISDDTMEDANDRPRARENVRNAIANHPKLSVLVGIWSYNAPAIVDVVRELNRRKDFTVVVFDAEPQAITALGEGNIDAMVVQNPFRMGYDSIRMLAALVGDNKDVLAEMLPNFGKPDGDIFDTGLKVVVPNADSLLKADQFDKGVEFLTLDKFQEWLKKYGLSGS